MVGAILAGGFGLLRHRPLAVLAWAAAYFIGSILLALVLGLLIGGGIWAMMTQGSGDAAAPFVTLLWALPLVYLAMLFLICVVMNAAFRAVLRPAERSFASLRVGMDEVRALGLIVLFLIVGIAAYFIVVLLLMFLASAVGLASGGDPRVQGPFGILLMLGIFCGFVWLGVRLSLVFPLTLYRRRIVIDDAWALSKGRFWTLFAAYFVVWAIFIIASMLLMLPVIGSIMHAMMTQGAVYVADPYEIQLQRQAMIEAAMPHGVAAALWYIGILLVSVFGYALIFGVQASAARELLIRRGDWAGDGPEEQAPLDQRYDPAPHPLSD